MNEIRPKQHLIELSRDYPGAWEAVDHFLREKGKSLPNWASWCFLPVEVVGSSVRLTAKTEEQMHAGGALVARLTVLAAWRFGQGIYRFDPTVFEAVWETPLTGNLPVEILYYLPEYCVYVETPGKKFCNMIPLHGFFACLSEDKGLGSNELVLLLDTEDGLFCQITLLKKDSNLEACIAPIFEDTKEACEKLGFQTKDDPVFTMNVISEGQSPLVSLLIYLCQESAEIRDNSGSQSLPSKPKPTKIKKGYKFFPPEKPKSWDVGYRTGPALRTALKQYSSGGSEPGSTGGTKAPHLRRAHYHHYWIGPKPSQTSIVKWLHPMLVGVQDADQLIPTVRKVLPFLKKTGSQ